MEEVLNGVVSGIGVRFVGVPGIKEKPPNTAVLLDALMAKAVPEPPVRTLPALFPSFSRNVRTLLEFRQKR